MLLYVKTLNKIIFIGVVFHKEISETLQLCTNLTENCNLKIVIHTYYIKNLRTILELLCEISQY